MPFIIGAPPIEVEEMGFLAPLVLLCNVHHYGPPASFHHPFLNLYSYVGTKKEKSRTLRRALQLFRCAKAA